ncbi:BURP domain protein USPL1-like [Capsicum annuum]|uniref:BURP domain protein USPL1-like n=1 Tax=Capsicum annuum TaxID=4072 RepID=UPI001FB0B230|nr:BURP domain protein USPL1-like [Capsicum annuum]
MTSCSFVATGFSISSGNTEEVPLSNTQHRWELQAVAEPQIQVLLVAPANRSSVKFFPKEVADTIPFSLKELPNLLHCFSFSEYSPQAKAIKDVLRLCELEKPMKGETKYCATSAEEMLNFFQGIMGEKTQIKALSTIANFSVEHSITTVQNYTILDVPQEVAAPKMVACHIAPCAYPIFYCHHTVGDERKVFKVSLRNEANGDRVEATWIPLNGIHLM